MLPGVANGSGGWELRDGARRNGTSREAWLARLLWVSAPCPPALHKSKRNRLPQTMVLGLRARRCQIGGGADVGRRPLVGPALVVGIGLLGGLACGGSGESGESGGSGGAVSAGVTSSAPSAAELDGGSPPPGGDAGAPGAESPQATLGREAAAHRERPSGALLERACSFEEAVCVHGAVGVSAGALGATLRHAEGALRVQRALGIPPPLPDGLFGGSPALDIYVMPGSEAPFVSIDAEMRIGRFDRSSAFLILPPPDSWDFCEARFRTARAVAEASFMGLDAGAEGGYFANGGELSRIAGRAVRPH